MYSTSSTKWFSGRPENKDGRTLRHFRLLLCNHLSKIDETWQEAICQRPLQYEICVNETWQESTNVATLNVKKKYIKS